MAYCSLAFSRFQAGPQSLRTPDIPLNQSTAGSVSLIDMASPHLPIRFHEVQVGEEFGPIRYTVKSASHTKHLEKLQNHQPLYASNRTEQPLLFPFETWCLPRVLSHCKYGLLGEIIQTSAYWKFFASARLGDVLKGSCRMEGKFIKDGLPHIVVSSETRDQNDDLILKTFDELLLLADHSPVFQVCKGHRDARDSNLRVAKLTARPLLPDDPLTLGAELPGLIKIAEMRMDWSDPKWQNNTHNKDYALKLGFLDALVEGFIPTEHLVELHVQAFGLDWYNGGVVDITYVHPIYPKDHLSVWSRLRAIELGSNQNNVYVFEVRVINETCGAIANIGRVSVQRSPVVKDPQE